MTTKSADAAAEEGEVVGAGTLALVGDTEIDIQVATARRFPRSIQRFMQKAQEMATLTPDIAASCIYALPRKENGKQKNIEGPSARLAEICASAWGNLRAEGKIIGHDDEFVTARGTAWDVESNVALAYEVRRRITDREGRRYSADMIGVTGNAGASIALRNAILKVVPTPFWKPIYLACRQVVAGDARTFQTRRDNMLHEFAVMGVTEERLCAAIEVKGKLDITLEHMATLAGFFTALKEGETTIEEAFPDGGGTVQPAQRKSQQPSGGGAGGVVEVQQAPTGGGGGGGGTMEAHPPSSTGAGRPIVEQRENVGIIVRVSQKDTGTSIALDTGFVCATKTAELITAALALCAKQTRVELVTKAPRDATKYARTLLEIIPESAS